MKKCPICDKEFPDSMRFCQTDGTPLVEAAAPPPDDPYKTTVGRQEDIKSAMPPVDPFATMVNTSFKKGDSDDLLQLPEEKNDPLKTMYVSEGELQGAFSNNKTGESKDISVPPVALEKDDAANDIGQPAPPVFAEPNITPPSFEDVPLTEQKTAIVSNPFNEPEKSEIDTGAQSALKTEVVSSSFNETPKIEDSLSAESKPSSPFDNTYSSPFEPKTSNTFDSSPYGNGGNTGPIPSPFDASMPPGYQQPSAPLPTYKEPEKTPPLPTYEEPKQDSYSNSSPYNQPISGQSAMTNQSDNAQNQDWNPPPVTDAGWQNQPDGQNVPSQMPAAGGQNQTLAIVSLVLGIIGLCGGVTAPFAFITGIMARKKASNFPNEYGGAGLALGGIITGIIGTVFLILAIIYVIFVLVVVGSQM